MEVKSSGYPSEAEAAIAVQMMGNAFAGAAFFNATERQRLHALVNAEMDIANQLHTDDFQLISPAGRTLSKAEYLGGIASGQIDYRVFEPTSAIDVRLYADVVIIRYQSRIEIVAFGEEHSDRGWHTDVYERHDGQWQIVWSQMTRITE